MSGIKFTKEQVDAVQSIWSVVEQNLKQHGINVFIRLFDRYPHTHQLFRSLKDIPLDVLATKPALKAHGVGVMKEFSGFVDNMDDMETLLAAMKGNAVRHYGRMVTVKDYECLVELIHDYLAEQLGDLFTKDASDGWTLLGKALTTTIAKEYKDMEAKECYWGSWCAVM